MNVFFNAIKVGTGPGSGTVNVYRDKSGPCALKISNEIGVPSMSSGKDSSSSWLMRGTASLKMASMPRILRQGGRARYELQESSVVDPENNIK
jgi:hypothetical protein